MNNHTKTTASNGIRGRNGVATLAAGVCLVILAVASPSARAAAPAADEIDSIETAGNLEAIVTGAPIRAAQGAHGEDLGKWSAYAEPFALSVVEPDPKAPSDHGDRAKGALYAVASTVGSVLYFPVKMLLGVGGAWLGGIAGAVSGGDQATASGIWNVTTDGDYFLSPEELEGTQEFRLTGDHR